MQMQMLIVDNFMGVVIGTGIVIGLGVITLYALEKHRREDEEREIEFRRHGENNQMDFTPTPTSEPAEIKPVTLKPEVNMILGIPSTPISIGFRRYIETVVGNHGVIHFVREEDAHHITTVRWFRYKPHAEAFMASLSDKPSTKFFSRRAKPIQPQGK